MTHPTNTAPSQKSRWMLYGTTGAILVIAVLAIVILLNVLVYRGVRTMSWMRMDFTQSRQYSLSPQTMGLIQGLDKDVTVTMLYAQGSEAAGLFGKIKDLLDEYSRRSSHILVRTIDPASDPDGYDKFLAELLNRYPDQVEANRKAFTDLKELYKRVQAFAEQQNQTLGAVFAKLPDGQRQSETGMLFQQVGTFWRRVSDEIKPIEEALDRTLEEKLPDFRGARQEIVSSPISIASIGTMARTLKQVGDYFERFANDPTVPASVKDAVLGLKGDYARLEAEITAAAQSMANLKTEDYDQLRSALGERNTVVVSLPQAPAPKADETKPADKAAPKTGTTAVERGVVVLGLNEIFPVTAMDVSEQGEVRPQTGYRGEEVITGAVLRLTLNHKTKVVFVNPMPTPVLMRGGGQLTFVNVAERLGRMNYEVTEWQPTGGQGPMGQPMPPQPPPAAEPGQTMVFVVLPSPPPDMRNPMMQPPAQMVSDALKNHLESGQPACVFLAPSSLMTMGQPDPLAEPLKPYGITVQTGRLVLTQVAGAQGKARSVNQLEISDWNPAAAVSAAVRGLKGICVQAMPIELPATAPDGVTQTWLARTPADTWSSTDTMDPSQAKRNPDDPKGPFNVAVSAQKDKTRLVVVAEPVFASDMITTFGRVRSMTGEALYADFPGNAELFVNSVYWLSGQEKLIAPGARSQDVRRIGDVSRSQMITISILLLAGLPLACLGVGVAIWAVRRR